jgi:hypothetical protein
MCGAGGNNVEVIDAHTRGLAGRADADRASKSLLTSTF